MASSILTFELFPEDSLHIFGFSTIQNGQEIMDTILNSGFPGVALNPQHIWSLFHLHTAANVALYRSKHEKMKTRSLNTELIYWLSGRTSIKFCLETFGFSPSLDSAIVCLFNPTEEELGAIHTIVQGEAVSVEDLLSHEASLTSEKAMLMRELFEIEEEELNAFSYSDPVEKSIVGRITFKHVERS